MAINITDEIADGLMITVSFRNPYITNAIPITIVITIAESTSANSSNLTEIATVKGEEVFVTGETAFLIAGIFTYSLQFLLLPPFKI